MLTKIPIQYTFDTTLLNLKLFSYYLRLFFCLFLHKIFRAKYIFLSTRIMWWSIFKFVTNTMLNMLHHEFNIYYLHAYNNCRVNYKLHYLTLHIPICKKDVNRIIQTHSKRFLSINIKKIYFIH